MRILILDDDSELAASLSDVLNLEGHEVVAVTRIEEARRALADRGFETAVFDLNLEEDNAIGLLREVRRDHPDLRVLVMTGGGKVAAGVGLPLATAHGAEAVLFKPFSNAEFLAAVTGAK